MKDKDPGDFDLDEKARMMRLLNHYFKLRPLTDEVLFFNRSDSRMVPGQPLYHTKDEINRLYFVHRPDLLIKNFDEYLIAVESFLYAGIVVMTYLLWKRVVRKP